MVEGPTSRLVVCAIYATPTTSLELRVGYASDLPLHSERLDDLESARLRARQWLEVVRTAGSIDAMLPEQGSRDH